MNRLILFLICSVIFITTDHVSASESICDADSVDGIIIIINNGIKLNENFKQSVNKDKDLYLKNRHETELYTENQLIPCLIKASDILGQNREVNLLNSVLRLVLSYGNSADEMIPYSLGMIFGTNPDELETSITRMNVNDRKLIIDMLSFGWMNARQRFNYEIRDNINLRLEKLKKNYLIQ